MREKEKKDKEDLFLAAEDAKPKDQQIQELRAKLYEANKLLTRARFALNLKDLIAKYPFFWYSILTIIPGLNIFCV